MYEGRFTAFQSAEEFEVWRRKYFYPFKWAQRQAEETIVARWIIKLK